MVSASQRFCKLFDTHEYRVEQGASYETGIISCEVPYSSTCVSRLLGVTPTVLLPPIAVALLFYDLN